MDPERLPLHLQRIRPSRLKQLALCPGSAWEEAAAIRAGVRDTTSAAAAEGTAKHALVEQALRGRDVATLPADAGTCVSYARRLAEDGRTVTAEVPVRMAELGIPRGGTIDLVASGPSLHIADWKFGQQSQGPATDNLQLAAYAAAIGATLGASAVTVHLVEPNAGGVTTASLGVAEAAERVARIAFAAQDPGAPRNPGPACRYCLGKATCPARQAATPAVERPASEDPAAWGAAVTRAKEAKAAAEDVIDAAKQRLESGALVDGWALGKPVVTRDVDAAAVVDRLDGIGRRDALVAAMRVSLPTLERALGAQRSVIADLITETAGAARMVPA